MDPGSWLPRVVVVADDPLSRRGVAGLLSGRGDVAVAGDTGRGAVAAALVTHDPDALVWDLARDAWEAPELGRPLPVVVLTDDADAARQALDDGARAVLRRDVEPHRLAAAVHAACADLFAVDPALADVLAPPLPRVGDDPLTAREAEVLALLAEGRSNADVGLALGISTNTARFHVQAVLEKLGADNRTDAVVRALRLGWLRL